MEEDTANLTLAYAASTNSSGIEGRAICNARTNHWVSDDGGGDAVYSGELFLSGIPSCAVNMVERLARTDNIVLEWMGKCLWSPTVMRTRTMATLPSMMPSVSNLRCGE